MIDINDIFFNEELEAQTIMEELDATIASKANFIISQKDQGRNMYLQEKELNSLYNARLFIENILDSFKSNLTTTQNQFYTEIVKRDREIFWLKNDLKLFYDSADQLSNSYNLVSTLLIKTIEKKTIQKCLKLNK